MGRADRALGRVMDGCCGSGEAGGETRLGYFRGGGERERERSDGES